MILMRFFFWCLITLGSPKNLNYSPPTASVWVPPPEQPKSMLAVWQDLEGEVDKTELNDDKNVEVMKKQTTSIQTNTLIVQKRI